MVILQVVTPCGQVHRMQIYAAPAGPVLPIMCISERRLRHVRQADSGHQKLQAVFTMTPVTQHQQCHPHSDAGFDTDRLRTQQQSSHFRAFSHQPPQHSCMQQSMPEGRSPCHSQYS